MASNRLSTKKDFQYWMQAAQNNYGSLFITVKTLSELKITGIKIEVQLSYKL